MLRQSREVTGFVPTVGVVLTALALAGALAYRDAAHIFVGAGMAVTAASLAWAFARRG